MIARGGVPREQIAAYGAGNEKALRDAGSGAAGPFPNLWDYERRTR